MTMPTDSTRLLAGRYELGALIGRGGMSDVHLATDARLGRRVAIKLLKPSLANDPAFRTRFRQEAQAAARMAHPTIVRVFDAGEETVREPDGAESARAVHRHGARRGPPAQGHARRRPRSPAAEAGRIIEGVLTALEYSHRAGVVHRDIKPGNVMVTRTGQVKVMDFGIARAISDSSATVAQTSTILGTAQYFSPEQARGESVDARTDLYSTGVVLFELLTGRPPFRGDSPVAVAYQHVSEAPVAAELDQPRVSPALDAVVLHALAKDRFERFQTATEFRADVEAAAAGQVPPTRTDTRRLHAPPCSASTRSATAGTEATLRQLTVDDDERRSAHPDPPAGRLDLGAASPIIAVVVAAVLFWAFNLERDAPRCPRARPSSAGRRRPDLRGRRERSDRRRPRPRAHSASSSTHDAEGADPRTDPRAGITVVSRSGRCASSCRPVLRAHRPGRAQLALEAAPRAGASRRVGSGTARSRARTRRTSARSRHPHRPATSGARACRAGRRRVDLVVSNGLVPCPTSRNLPDQRRRRRSSAPCSCTSRVQADNWLHGQDRHGPVAPPGDQPQKSEIIAALLQRPTRAARDATSGPGDEG